MNRRAVQNAEIRPNGFVSHEFLFAVAGLAICAALCLPILAAMRDCQISPLVGSAIIAAICFVFLIPRFMSALSERSWRRRMKACEQEDQGRTKSL